MHRKEYAIGAAGMLLLVTAILLATGRSSAIAAQITNAFVTNKTAPPTAVREPQRTERRSTHDPENRGFVDFVVDGRSSSTVYAATGSGVFKSSDGGATWRSANDGLTDTHLLDLVADPRHPSTLYAGTQTRLFKSTDAAATWKATGLTRRWANAVAVHPRRSGIVYVGNEDGVFKTVDGGEHWRKVWRGTRVFAVAIDPRRPGTVYAGTGRGVIKSTDAGASWAVMSRGLFIDEGPDQVQHRLMEGFVTALAIDPSNPRTLYAGCDYGVFKSTDRARSWKLVRSGLPHVYQWSLVGALALHPRRPQTLYTGSAARRWPNNRGGVYKSTNGGRSWRSLGVPDRQWTIAIGLDPLNPGTLYVGATRGSTAYKSTDAGGHWQALVVPGL